MALNNFANQTVVTEAAARAAWQPLNSAAGFMPASYKRMEPQGTNQAGERVYSVRTIAQTNFQNVQGYSDAYMLDRRRDIALSATPV